MRKDLKKREGDRLMFKKNMMAKRQKDERMERSQYNKRE